LNIFTKNKNQKIKKIALLISTNYLNTPYELRGCNNDINLIYNLLINIFNYSKEDIILLTDYTTNIPTKQNLMKIFNKIILVMITIGFLYLLINGFIF